MKEKLFCSSRRGDLTRILISQFHDDEEIKIDFVVNQHRGDLNDLKLLMRDLQVCEIAQEVIRGLWIAQPETRKNYEVSVQHLLDYYEKEQFLKMTEISLDEELSISNLCQENSKQELADTLLKYLIKERKNPI
ncbi:MAG: hypothetical protein COB02_16785 [Candidatus Cloacimonadota bacterium]|nr:MAG: hypothetical protein COB02_16785 [Candidatus Cloacimonadota bacterium]